MSGSYRGDIDGLRALAVLPVLLFHAGVPGFSGGYVGVDVFFVISGFLIGGIVAREIDAGSFTLVGFYERRARRIMPALMLTVFAVLATAAWLYFPGDFRDVPRSAVAATLFASNLHFFATTGYFAGGAETRPLLHTWSLAVEEQFYLGFPLLLMLTARFAPRRRSVIVAAVALVSFALASATQSSPSGIAFYMLPMRAWELLAGSLLAFGAVPEIRRGREMIVLAGLAAIGAAIVLYTPGTSFPGIAALPPVLGAAAVIHAAPATRTGALLRWRPLVAVGLISYSLYLVHWPLVVFTEYATDQPLTGWARVAVIAASLALAALSWRFVERPSRRPGRIGRPVLFAATGAAMAGACAVSALMIAADGWPGRFSPEIQRIAATQAAISPERARCHDAMLPCLIGSGTPRAALWGDSHGVELAYALASRGAVVELTHSSCPPVLGYDPPHLPGCAPANRAAFAGILADRRLGTVYLAAFWAKQDYRDAPNFAAQIDETVARLKSAGRRVVLIGPVPPNPYDVPRRLAHLAQAGRPAPALDRGPFDRMTAWFAGVAARTRARGATVVEPATLLCSPTRCAIERGGVPLYFDSHHLSLAGAEIVARAAVGR